MINNRKILLFFRFVKKIIICGIFILFIVYAPEVNADDACNPNNCPVGTTHGVQNYGCGRCATGCCDTIRANTSETCEYCDRGGWPADRCYLGGCGGIGWGGCTAYNTTDNPNCRGVSQRYEGCCPANPVDPDPTPPPDSTPTPSPTPTPEGPSNITYACSLSGDEVTINWDMGADAEYNIIRLNHSPANFSQCWCDMCVPPQDVGWFCGPEGDQFICPLPFQTSHVAMVTPGVNYEIINMQATDDLCAGRFGSSVQALLPFGCCTFDYETQSLTGVGDSITTTTSSRSIPPGRSVNSVTYSFEGGVNNAIIDPDPDPNTTIIDITALQIGTGNYRAYMILDDGTACDDYFDITVSAPTAWSQFENGSIMTDGSINIPVPLGNYLMIDGPGGYPGIPIAGGSISYAPGFLSTRNWSVPNAPPYAGTLPAYANFRDRIPSAAVNTLGASADQATLLSGSVDHPSGSGYYYFEHDGSTGNLTIEDTGDIDIGTNKIVIFVDGDVNIESKIRLTKGLGFFMLIASGNITVDPSVGGDANDVPELEGVYFTDGDFVPGTLGSGLDQQLHVRGVVVAGNRVVLERSTAFTDIPGELFEYGVDQSMLIPPALSSRAMTWKEVLP